MVADIKDPAKEIVGANGLTLMDFWKWAYSDINSNATRGVFAEFLVGAALGVLSEPRLEWDAVDLHYNDRAIEVKSAAYIQSWPQSQPSKISFDIAKKRSWDARTNTYDSQLRRSANCYVFCLFAAQDEGEADVLNMTQWRFYIIATEQLDNQFGEQASLTLSRLEQVCTAINYNDLKSGIDRTLGLSV